MDKDVACAAAPRVNYYEENQMVYGYTQQAAMPDAGPVPPQNSLSSELYGLRNQFISFVEQTTAEVNSLKQRVAWLESRLG